MGHAYTPGLRVTERTLIKKKRILPIPGEVIVRPSDRVKAEDVIAQTKLPGAVHTVNVINLLNIPPEDIRDYMLKREGDPVKKGEVIAQTRPIIKIFRSVVRSPIDGIIESISEITGQVLLREPPTPLELWAYVDGVVTELIEGAGAFIQTECSFIQGIFGVGGERYGILRMVCKNPEDELKSQDISPQDRGKILVGGSFADAGVWKKAVEVGARGIVVGGIDDKDLRELLGYDLGVAITGTEEIGFTLIITEGFGRIAMAKKTFDLLVKNEGKRASISGATQIRAGVIRPEIIIPLDEEASFTEREFGWEPAGLKIGDLVRVIREPFFGRLGRVKSLPNELQLISTESKVRILEVEFLDGGGAIIPRANVEIIES
jgi:hypothetical protein